MEKLGFGPGRKELQETVETQRKQLLQYQSRFKDVVRAYKSLLKEKEALEASLTVLSVSQQDHHGGPPPLRTPPKRTAARCTARTAWTQPRLWRRARTSRGNQPR
ncbi:hypothetical protein CesoFtcFv8_026477 [Champsocephalus esox]|uniref:Uncharacterized protein n=2 Tax=Champsocephalus TaxID=52236 RepID=A0AAN8C450_CHAGU|nr:hypothetical protein CesoFtcFv8_026477 [Champsocephalus esox]KAK5896427.1 hypothetical protein CgunFtcFv8_010026 [Champsocephalus gunnari]